MVAGVGAGVRVPLSGGVVVIGRDATAGLRMDDGSVSRLHARVFAPRGGRPADWMIEDLGSANGTWVDGARVDGPAPLTPQAAIEIGASVLEVRPVGAVPGPMPVAPAPVAPMPVPVPPGPPERPVRAWVAAVLPLVLAAALLAAGVGAAAAAVGALSPVMLLTSWLAQRHRRTDQADQARARYEARLTSTRLELAELAAREAVAARARWPDPAALTELAAERGPTQQAGHDDRPGHDDQFVVRVGVTDRRLEVTWAGPPTAASGLTAPTLHAVPVTVDLRAAGAIVLYGPAPAARAAARSVVAQLALWHHPRALHMGVATSEAGPDGQWAWVRRLPHGAAWTDTSLEDLVGRLRQAAAPHRPALVMILDGAGGRADVARLLDEGPRRGIFSVVISAGALPGIGAGHAEIAVGPHGEGSLTWGPLPPARVLLDQVGPVWAAGIADRLGGPRRPDG